MTTHTSPLALFSTVMLAEARRSNASLNAGTTPQAKDIVHRFSLAEYRAALQESGIKKFPLPQLLANLLKNIEHDRDSFALYCPPGSQILVALMPTNSNGTIYTQEDIQTHQALQLFLIDPATTCTLTGDTIPALLPPELWKQCSFNAQYSPTGLGISSSDLEHLKNQIKTATANLIQLTS